MAMSNNLSDYHKSILETLRHIEDIVLKLALQNYAAAGAVFLAYYAGKMPLKVAAPAVVGLGVVFTWAIWTHTLRYMLLWKMHRILRDNWLAGQTALLAAFHKDPECARYLAIPSLRWFYFVPLHIINLVPAGAAVLIVIGTFL